MKILVTGAAGFIGTHLCLRLLAQHHEVVGIDNLNPYYDPALKRARLHQLQRFANFRFYQADIADASALSAIFAQDRCQYVVHLAAQAGVRYSIDHPESYFTSNLLGFGHILEQCRRHRIAHLIYASSSSVYGMQHDYPFSESANTDHPVSLYGATKKANEVMAESYAHLYQLPCTGLRFFTVYGPYGRPDMAPIKFTQKILAQQPLEIYNQGDLARDFTYIDDIIDGIDCILQSEPVATHRLFNLGRGEPVRLMDFITTLERALGVPAIKHYLPMQAGDVYATYASTEAMFQQFGYAPRVSLQEGIARMVRWYHEYYATTATRIGCDGRNAD